MKIAMSGYRGLTGTVLEKYLGSRGHHILRLSRSDLYMENIPELSSILEGCNAVIHLAGAPVLQRWTQKNRTEIYNSRIIPARQLVSAIIEIPEERRPEVFISASAIGIYKHGETHDEGSDRFDSHFAAQVTQDWEEASEHLPDNVRRVVFRTGLILARQSKLIRQLWLPFKAGVGGKVASGKQPFPFVHLKDVVRAYAWALENKQSSGIYNLTAPELVNNKQFTGIFASLMHRRAILPVPGFFLRLLYGDAAEIIIHSPSVIPERLVNEGFTFQYPFLRDALEEIVRDELKGPLHNK